MNENMMVSEDKSGTLASDDYKEPQVVCYGISRSALKGGMNAGGMPVEKNVQPAITANGSAAVCYDARGNGMGKIAPTITGDHQNRITDYTAIVIERVEDAMNETE